jgi:hypothetical protein
VIYKEFMKYLQRDQRCYHCGSDGDDLVPQHRLNRGSGGKNAKAAQPSNIIVLCSFANGLAESDAGFARICRDRGWKLHSWQNPATTPVFDVLDGVWYALDNKFGRIVLPD